VNPRIATTIDAVRQAVAHARRGGQTIGLVPTMGALHAGHASLIHAARAETDLVVVSIFVNPTQFGPKEDFGRYPRPFDSDVALCAAENVALIFHPEPAVMYPPDFCTYVEATGLQDVLCGASRPGHFRGVATIVLKLFNIVQPDVAFFGQKDAQQARLLRQMVADLDVPVRVVICPIVREADGLAVSSRNQYLTPAQRQRATVLHDALEMAEQSVKAGERRPTQIIRQITERIAATEGARLDYAAIVDAQSLQPLENLQGHVLVALAVWFGTTRLIDNVILEVKD
jgi:pantoate--beta-alanine ligase